MAEYVVTVTEHYVKPIEVRVEASSADAAERLVKSWGNSVDYTSLAPDSGGELEYTGQLDYSHETVCDVRKA